MISTSMVIEDKTYELRYENKQQQDIRKNAPKKLHLGKEAAFSSPMNILNFLDDIDVQIYLIEQGLQWKESGIEKIDTDKAAELRQAYLEQGDADSGEKYEAFQGLLADALSLNVLGASGKKLLAKGKEEMARAKEEREKTSVEEIARINEGRILAQARAKVKLEAEGLGLPGKETSPGPA